MESFTRGLNRYRAMENTRSMFARRIEVPRDLSLLDGSRWLALQKQRERAASTKRGFLSLDGSKKHYPTRFEFEGKSVEARREQSGRDLSVRRVVGRGIAAGYVL